MGFLPLKAEPFEIPDYCFDKFRPGTCCVDIFDTQEKSPVASIGELKVQYCRKSVTKV